MRVVVLFSAGKDSTYSIWWALQQGYEVLCLLTALPSEESMMFQHPNVRWASLSAKGMGLPQEDFAAGEGEDAELLALKTALSKFAGKADAVVAGALASDYQKNRIDRICEKLGLKSFCPLWHKNQENLLREIVASGFDIRIVGCFAEGLDEKWLGRRIDSHAIDSLVKLNSKFSVSIGGEGGEFETFVVDSPLHEKRVEILEARNNWRGNSGVFEITRAVLREKPKRSSRD